MLRALVLVLLLLNTAYWAWSQAWLSAWGLAPPTQAEPQRLQQQIQPQAVRVLSPEQWRQAEAAARQPANCLEAGLFNAAQAQALRGALEQALPGGERWRLQDAREAAHWIVYMGKYISPELLARKGQELQKLGVSVQPVRQAALQPGFSLGDFATQAEAEAELQALSLRGVRSAKVVLEQAAQPAHLLRLPDLDPAEVARVQALPALAGKTLRPCAAPPSPSAPPAPSQSAP